MTVKIDMEMPKSCSECRFCTWSASNARWMCTATPVCVRYMTKLKCFCLGRRSYCPLQEVKE